MTDDIGLQALTLLYPRIMTCERCELSKTRKQVVFGTGNSEVPDIAFIGPPPGEAEDASSYPFLAEEYVLLHAGIKKLGYRSDDLYYLHAVSCRPPDRAVLKEEIAACRPAWQSQLIAVAPKTIVCLGEDAAFAVLNQDDVPSLRGKWHEWRSTPVRVTLAPSALKGAAEAKQMVWDDLVAVRNKLSEMRLGI